jgi:Na+-driven multidrug efflux pump
VMLATGSAYLARVGPFYGFFGFGLALYFASQGAGKLLWPLLAGLLRLGFGIGAGWLLLTASGAIEELFLALGVALALYGIVIGLSVAAGAWFPDGRKGKARP